MTLVNPRKYRLAAFDLDGTLLGPDTTISPANRKAVERLHQTGVEIVLASGRHHANVQKIAESLPSVRWIVSSQGGEVSDINRRQRLHEVFLEPTLSRKAVLLGLKLGFSIIVYANDNVRATAENEDVHFYARLAGNIPTGYSPDALLTGSIFKIIWIGNNTAQFEALAFNSELASLNATKVRTHQRLFEIMPPDVTKGSALAVLAKHLGIDSRDAAVFGDGENDIPMFAWAGTSVAMPHGWSAARECATFVAPPGPPETALARGIEMLWPNAS